MNEILLLPEEISAKSLKIKNMKALSRDIYEDVESVIILTGLDYLTYGLLDLPGKDNGWILCRKTTEVQ